MKQRDLFAEAFNYQVSLQHGLCFYCEKIMVTTYDGNKKQPPNLATRDHYLAKSNGGKLIVAACKRCNGIKGHMNAEKFKWALDRILQNSNISAFWDKDIRGLDKILVRMIPIEIWTEKQKDDYNFYRECRIKKEIDDVLKLITKLKL